MMAFSFDLITGLSIGLEYLPAEDFDEDGVFSHAIILHLVFLRIGLMFFK